MNPIRVIVSGATGFIGTNLLSRLSQENFEVHALHRDVNNFSSINLDNQNIFWHRISFNGDNLLEPVLQEVKPDIVFHLASCFIAEHKSDDIDGIIKSNILFGTKLLEAMNKAGCSNLINTGTSWQHYINSNYNPVCLYAASKQAFESIIEYYVQANRFKVITLKLFDTYGANDNRNKLINLLKSINFSGKKVDMSSGDQLLDLLHIDDVIDAYLVASKRIITMAPQSHERYGLSSGERLSLREVVGIFEKVFDNKLNINWGARSYRAREVMTPWIPEDRLPNWFPKVRLADGIKSIKDSS